MLFLWLNLQLKINLKPVRHYIYDTESLKDISDSIPVDNALLRLWIQQYKHHGEKAFEKRYASYTLEYKLDLLNYMNDNGTSIRETATIFNIPAPSTLRQWKRLLETEGIDALKPKRKGRPSMKKENQKQSKKQQPKEGSVEELQAVIE